MNNTINPKKWFFSFIGLTSSLIAVFFAFLFAYDPYMLFHKPIKRDVTLHSNMRLQAAGIINSLDHDAYILGTSMFENSSADLASKLLGHRFANISMSGSNYYERKFPLDYALNKGAKRVIYSLDSYYTDQPTENKTYPAATFDYLYSDNPYKLKLYLQSNIISCAVQWSDQAKCVGHKKTTDMPNQWISSKRHNARFGGLEKWFDARNDNQIKQAFSEIRSTANKIKNGGFTSAPQENLEPEVNKAVNYIENNVLAFVRANPNTHFDLVFPPYFRAIYAGWHQLQSKEARAHEAVIYYVAKEASKLNNVTVYGYEDQDFLDDIANYKDLRHYTIWVNEMIMKGIADGRNIITPHNVDQYIQTARNKGLEFDLVALGEEVDMYLNRN